MLKDQKELIQAILNRIKSEIRKVLKREITIKTKEERLELIS